MKQIFNMGVFGGILKIAKEDGAILSEKDEARLAYLESLPKNQWIDLDENGLMISKTQADENIKQHLSNFKPINQTK